MALAVACAGLSGANRDPVFKTAFGDLLKMYFSSLSAGRLALVICEFEESGITF